VIADATPESVNALGGGTDLTFAANRIGTIVTGPVGDRVIDYADRVDGPVYDVMYHSKTGWFAVTIYRGLENTVRWDNRPDANPGYPRVDTVLGASSPLAILDALDIDPALVDYHPS
jgi:hypothetical protein